VRLLAIILTKNEERNLPYAIESLRGVADRVLVFDSFSDDRTITIAQHMGADVIQREFVNFSAQRNAALHAARSYPADWILFVDADERVTPELAGAVVRVLATDPPEEGFYVGRRFYWRGHWVRRGYYPSLLLRLVRNGLATCGDREVNEHLVVCGPVGTIDGDLIHEDQNGFERWRERHLKYAAGEAALFFDSRDSDPSTAPSEDERQRRIRRRRWNRMPLRLRAFIYFTYVLFVRGAVLDGPSAWHYHFWQGLWYRLVIDRHILAQRASRAASNPT
jgi:glycosyltransferase involved in cell wall biosynthesis